MDTDSERASEPASMAGVDAGRSARIVEKRRGDEGRRQRQRQGTAAEISLEEIRDACLSLRNLSLLISSAPHKERSALHGDFRWNIL